MSLLNNFNIVDPASLLGLLAVALGIYCINYIVLKCRRDRHMVKFAETLPGPPGWPLIGNSLDFYFRKDWLNLMLEYNKKYGETFRLWLGKYLAVVLSNVEDLEIVFMSSKTLGKPKLFAPFEDFFGDGMFVTRSMHKWRRNRKTFLPVFGRSALPRYTSIVNDKVNHVINKLQDLVDGAEFDAWDYMPPLAFSIILKSTMNVDLDWEDESLLSYYMAAMNALDICLRKLYLPWLQHKLINYLRYQKQSRKYRGEANEFLRKLINSKKSEILKHLEAHRNKSAVSSEEIPPKNLLTIAYELAESENDENIMLDELLVILAAGSDPSVMTSFFLLAVAIHQDIQNKLYDELYEVFGDSDRPADVNDLDRLTYLDQVLKETLRRFPITAVIFRGAEEDIKLKDRVIPAGTMVIVSVAAVHFNPKYYPDPWKFDPDRFAPEVASKLHKLSLLAFSAGIRNCLGYHFAIMEMKLTLIALLREFAFHTRMKMEDILMDAGLVINSANGYKLTIKSRVKKPTYLNK